jgi:hypothetical protein
MSTAFACLIALLPFEPRQWALSIFGLRFTVLEVVAAVALTVAALARREHLPGIVRSPPAPIIAIWAYAGVQLLSAVAAREYRGLALVFALRMVAMAVFATVVAAAPEEVRRRALKTLAWTAVPVALLAVGEGLGLRALDPGLDLFRQGPITVDGLRRATAGSEHPNLAAAFLMYGLLAGLALGIRWPAAWVTLLVAGLAFTQSRGAALATLAGLLALAVRHRARTNTVATAAAVVVAFVAVGGRSRWLPHGPRYGARYEPAETALRLEPGQPQTTAVRVTNTGQARWSAARIRLSYHWLRTGGSSVEDGPRVALMRDVGPGEEVAIEMLVRAPATPGSAYLVWDLVDDAGIWFSGQGVSPAAVPVSIGGAALPETIAADAFGWRPGRLELWRLALHLWRERPLLGVGPDNFRRLYGRAAGRAFWDDRVYANQTLLEALATTGLAGALALLATLWLTLRAVVAASGPESTALVALTVGIAVHGLVDYVLAMTGHYLLFGFVVGAAAAAGGAKSAWSAASRRPETSLSSVIDTQR